MFNPFKTRKGRLESKLKIELSKITPDTLNNIVAIFDDYQKDNLDTIDKLKRNKKIELNKINGALKQTINAHGPITKELIGSASKRVHGALLENVKQSIPCISADKVIFLIIGIIVGFVLIKVFLL